MPLLHQSLVLFLFIIYPALSRGILSSFNIVNYGSDGRYLKVLHARLEFCMFENVCTCALSARVDARALSAYQLNICFEVGEKRENERQLEHQYFLSDTLCADAFCMSSSTITSMWTGPSIRTKFFHGRSHVCSCIRLASLSSWSAACSSRAFLHSCRKNSIRFLVYIELTCPCPCVHSHIAFLRNQLFGDGLRFQKRNQTKSQKFTLFLLCIVEK